MSRGAQQRAEVVAALAEVFRRYGYEGASLARISAGTGLGRGSLYNMFPGGKAEMAEAVLEHLHAWFETSVFQVLADQDPMRGLSRMFAAAVAYFHSGRRICLVGTFALDETRGRFAGAIRRYFVQWAEALAQCLERGGLGTEAARALAADVVAGIQGGLVLARALDRPEEFTACCARLERRCHTALETGGI